MKRSGNTILVTGGGSGIGLGLAERLQALGNDVIIAGRRKDVLDAATAAHPGMRSVTLDVADAASIEKFRTAAATEFPRLNVLINNAGIMRAEDLRSEAVGTATAEAIVATNLLGPIRLTSALLPSLKQQAGATVMNVTSGLAFVPLAMFPTYNATKAAMHSYSESLRYQLKDTEVEVIELIPPYVQTELGGAWQANDPNAMPLDAFLTEVMEILGQNPTPSEINVERVKPLRFAVQSSDYEGFFTRFNDMMTAALQ